MPTCISHSGRHGACKLSNTEHAPRGIHPLEQSPSLYSSETRLTHSHYAYVEGAVDMLDHNDTLGARQHRRVMWLGYYVVSQVLQATMLPSCRTRCITRSVDSASASCHRCLPRVPTYFSLITALCLWWSKMLRWSIQEPYSTSHSDSSAGSRVCNSIQPLQPSLYTSLPLQQYTGNNSFQ